MTEFGPFTLKIAADRPAVQTPEPPRKRVPMCVYLGDVLSTKDSSGVHVSCSGKHLRECELFGECRVSERWSGATCDGCKSRATERPAIEFPKKLEFPAQETVGSVRHLAYFIYPKPDHGVWQHNVKQLLPRLPLFNGKKIVCVSTGVKHRPAMRPDRTDSFDAVRSAFGDTGCEFIEVKNNVRLGEVVGWPRLWERILPGGPGDVTFYAHAKGIKFPMDGSTGVHRWTSIMYESLLDYWPLVREILQRHPTAGSFKKMGTWLPGATWHYSGSFCWSRNADTAKLPWATPRPAYGGTESFWGEHYTPKQGGVVFYGDHTKFSDLYDVGTMNRVIVPDFEQWKEFHVSDRLESPYTVESPRG